MTATTLFLQSNFISIYVKQIYSYSILLLYLNKVKIITIMSNSAAEVINISSDSEVIFLKKFIYFNFIIQEFKIIYIILESRACL